MRYATETLAPAGVASLDDDDAPAGRTLTQAEYLSRLLLRSDIFAVDRESRLKASEVVSITVAVATGMWLSHLKMPEVRPDFLEKPPTATGPARLLDRPIERPLADLQAQRVKKVVVDRKGMNRKVQPASAAQADARQNGGGGDPRERVAKKGVLGLLAGKVHGRTVADGDPFGKGGFASGLDGVLLGSGGLKSSGGGGAGLRRAAGIGFGTGYGSGFGGGSGGINDLVNNLMSTGGSGELSLRPRSSTLHVTMPQLTSSGAITGGRNRLDILRVVQQNMVQLRYAYNMRLRDKPALRGKVTVKFAIDEFGRVIFCSVVGSTVEDRDLETMVADKVRGWRFERIDKPGDVTEVVYPFVFSM